MGFVHSNRGAHIPFEPVQYFAVGGLGTNVSRCPRHLLRGTIVNRTYVLHKNLYISPFLLTIFGPINYGPP